LFAHGPQALPSNMSGGKITLRIDGQPVEKVLPTAGTIFKVPGLGAKVFRQLRDESTDTRAHSGVRRYSGCRSGARRPASAQRSPNHAVMPDRSRPLAAQKPLPSPAKRRATRTGGAPRAPPKAELREFVDSGPARKLMALQSSRDKKKALKKKNRSDELAARAHTVSATVVAPTPRLWQWLRPGGPTVRSAC